MKNDYDKIMTIDYIKTVFFASWYILSFLWGGFLALVGTFYLMASEAVPMWARVVSGVLTLITISVVFVPVFLQETMLKEELK